MEGAGKSADSIASLRRLKPATILPAAIGRELAGFAWAIDHQTQLASVQLSPLALDM
jgi:hypothetical protein